MNFFTVIPEAQGIIHAAGVYAQVPLYERGGKIYAKRGAGYVRLSQGGATSAPNVRWAEIDTPQGMWREAGGSVEYQAGAVQVREAAE